MAQPHNKKLGEYPMTTRGREQGPEKRYRRLRFPAFTAAKWTVANPLLQRGELGVETDTRKIKVGDGITYWNDLEYAKAYSDWGNIAGDITEQTDLVDFVNAAVAAEANIRSQADQQLQANIDNVAADLTEHEQDTNNPHNVTKAQVGLGNVDNTSDADKPVSTAQATAINNAVSTHNASETAHSNQFSQYRTSANQDTIDNQIKSDITNLQSTKADKATTLAGYGITDAYTKTEVDAKVSSVYRFRGSVATYANLPTTGQVVGDVWNVEDTGANYAWSGTEWDKLSETVDLTPYLTKEDAANTYATITTVNGKQDALTTNQLAAVNSGITADRVASYDAYAGEISAAKTTADKADNAAEVAQQTANLAGQEAAQALSGLANKVNIAQGTANAGKLLGIGNDGNVAPVDGASGTGRNIGDIFWTTRTDSALNGAVEANGAQYNFADVNGGDNNIQSLLDGGKLPYLPITEFDAMVAEQGGCDSFGYAEKGRWQSWYDGVDTIYLQRYPIVGDSVFDSIDGSIIGTVSEVRTGETVYMDYLPTGSETPVTNFSVLDYFNDIILPTSYFKVPKKLGRVLVRTQKPTADNNYTWFNLYSDGWVEQGGLLNITTSTSGTVTLPITMNTAYYNVIIQAYSNGTNSVLYSNRTSTSFNYSGNVGKDSWQVVGYADSAEYTPDKWDYQNIQVLRPMVQLFNGATDTALATCTEVLADVADLKQTTDGMIDYVVESQEPTEANGYTWYRLYKSGWVEQGGFGSGADWKNISVSLPIEMSDVNYTPIITTIRNVDPSSGDGQNEVRTISTTGFVASSGVGSSATISWQVSGMSAQGSN